MSLSKDEIEKRVTHHSPSEEGVLRHKRLSDAASAILSVIESVVPDGREKSLAITKIEEAKMWASAGVARNPETV